MQSPTLMHRSPARVWTTFQDAFLRHYDGFAPACRAVDAAAVTLVAIDGAGVDGILTIPARPSAIAAAVIGRHDRADLRLERHEDLALRHLALLVEPATTWRAGRAEVTYRLLDLRTGSGFTGERDQHLVAVRCGGSAFFRCAGYTLFALATGDASDWPESAFAAWDMIPERVLLDERDARRPPPPRPDPPCDGRRTAVHTLPRVGDLRSCDEPVAVITVEGRGRIGVDRAALAAGVLLGRYPRCDRAEWFDDPRVSRAHLLIVELLGEPHAIDLASTGGTRAGGVAVRAVRLGDEAELELASTTTLRWARL